MTNINFVPDDYIQSGESRRTNVMYLVLFAIVMAACGGSFGFIKIRSRALSAKQERIDKKMTEAQETIRQFEELQQKRKTMMKTALTTAELLEPVPRSVLLAFFTNNLPKGVSLLDLELKQQKAKSDDGYSHRRSGSKYKAQKKAKEDFFSRRTSPERFLETHISLLGVAPSDIQVATYIERLINCNFLTSVALVESKEHQIEKTTFRQFKLTATLRSDVHLTDEDIQRIRSKGALVNYAF